MLEHKAKRRSSRSQSVCASVIFFSSFLCSIVFPLFLRISVLRYVVLVSRLLSLSLHAEVKSKTETQRIEIIPLFIRMDEKQEVFWDLDLAERRKPRDEAIPEFGGNAALRGLLRPTPTEE